MLSKVDQINAVDVYLQYLRWNDYAQITWGPHWAQ